MRLSRIDRYPVKGMSPDTLRQSEFQPGRGLPFDRAAAVTSGNRGFKLAGAPYMRRNEVVRQDLSL